jgi:hypothetical protein
MILSLELPGVGSEIRGDGSKVTMHKMPECLESAELRTEYSSLLSEWLAPVTLIGDT